MAIGALRQAAIDMAGDSANPVGAAGAAKKVADLAGQLAKASSEDAPKLTALLNQASSELNQIMDALKKVYEIDQKMSKAPQ